MGHHATHSSTAAEPGGIRSSTMVWAVALSAGLLTVAIGTVNIDRSFNYDEAVTYARFVNGGSPWRALTTQLVFNNHQLFSVSQAVLWRVGFVGETSQRLAPVLCGAVTVTLLTGWVGRRTDVVVGAIAGLLLLANPVYVAEFRGLRGYSLATLAALVAALATHRSWHDHRLRWVLIAAASMVVAVATHAYSALPIVMVAIWTVALGHHRIAHVASWITAAVVTFLVQLPLLDDARASSRARGSRHFPEFPWRTAEAYLGERTAVVLLTGPLVLAGCWWLARRSRRHAVALVASVGLLLAVIVLLWQVVEPYDLYIRFFVSLTPYLAAVAAFGADAVPRRVGVVAALAAVCLLAPNVRDVVRSQPSIRDAASIVDLARSEGRPVCGAFTIPLSVYTAPVRSIDPTLLDGPNGYADCEVFIAVIGIGTEGRATADGRFERHTNLGGGVTLYSSAEFVEHAVAELGR